MATIPQTIYSDGFSWNEKFSILIRISLKFVHGAHLIGRYLFRWWLGVEQATSHIIWINADSIHQLLYAALEGDELTTCFTSYFCDFQKGLKNVFDEAILAALEPPEEPMKKKECVLL